MRSFVLLLIMVLLEAGCAGPGVHQTAQDRGAGLDRTALIQRAEEEEALLDGSGILYEEAVLQSYLEQVVRRLQAAAGARDECFKIRVVSDPYLNAFAFANGAIYVHTGILARLDNEAELAALLAHEMIHCLHRHAFKAAREFKVPARGDASLERASLHPGQAQDLSSLIFAFRSMALVAESTQKLETEADEGALRILREAGYDPGAALKVLEHLKKEAEMENYKEPFLFATHPSLEKRMENMRRMLYNDSFAEIGEGTTNEAPFLEKTSALILHNASLDLKAGRYAVALRGVQKYLTCHGPGSMAYFLMGEIFRQRGGTGDLRRAKAAYKTAILFDSSYSDPYKALGLIYYKERDWALAKTSFESCVALAPNHPDRAYIEEYLQRCKEASQGWDRHTGVISRRGSGS